MPDDDSIKSNITMIDGIKQEIPLMISFRPIGTRLCIKPVAGEETTKSGIVIPDTGGGERPQEGIVMAIGDELIDSGKKIEVGQRVLFSKYAGDEIRIRDQKGREVEFKILHYESLLGVLESESAKKENPSKIGKENKIVREARRGKIRNS